MKYPRKAAIVILGTAPNRTWGLRKPVVKGWGGGARVSSYNGLKKIIKIIFSKFAYN